MADATTTGLNPRAWTAGAWPNAAGVARWLMECTLSGEFVEFTAYYTHADELGGELTSLLDEVNTHELVQNVLVDLSGRDAIGDFLAREGDGYRVYESDGVDSAVEDKSASAQWQYVGKSAEGERYLLTVPETSGGVYVKVPYDGLAPDYKRIKSVIRPDGKILSLANVWISKTRQGLDYPWLYDFNLFDMNGGGTYSVVI